jgi:catechol 2,3-dioxygenase-like lactoylglutathione lyase family enzyme
VNRPLAFGHVGITVPDLDAAVDWYSSVLGLEVLSASTDLRRTGGYEGAAAAAVFGDKFERMRVAHLSAANGVGVELFEFVQPAVEATREDYRHAGPIHVCLEASDVEAAADLVIEAGGSPITAGAWDVAEGGPYRFSFCRDPWGNVIEFHSHPFEEIFSSQSQQTEWEASQ